GRSLDLGLAGYGISLGNSPAWTGLRVNFIDRDVRRVDGINLTLWRPDGNLGADFNGFAIGAFGPEARTIRGAGIGLAGVVADRELRGLALAGGAVYAGGSLDGIAFGGGAVVTSGSLDRVALGGGAVVAGGSLRGLARSPGAVVPQGDSSGIAIAGLAT